MLRVDDIRYIDFKAFGNISQRCWQFVSEKVARSYVLVAVVGIILMRPVGGSGGKSEKTTIYGSTTSVYVTFFDRECHLL
jgi:hypothetical protein